MNRNELIGRIYKARHDVECAADCMEGELGVEFVLKYPKSGTRTEGEELAFKAIKDQKLYLLGVLDSLTEIMDDLCRK